MTCLNLEDGSVKKAVEVLLSVAVCYSTSKKSVNTFLFQWCKEFPVIYPAAGAQFVEALCYKMGVSGIDSR